MDAPFWLNNTLRADPGTPAARGSMPPLNACWRTMPIISTHPRAIATFFLVQLTAMFVLNMWHLGSITQPEAFCAGTTAAYRKGNGSNSALTPPHTPHPPITPPPVDARNMHPV